jgi:hypothetical protein
MFQMEEAGCTTITLHVKVGNDSAIQFYQKNHFLIDKRLHKHYEIKGKLYDAVQMKKDLDRGSAGTYQTISRIVLFPVQLIWGKLSSVWYGNGKEGNQIR